LKEKLIIKNFGPIKSVDLDLGKITVLIGEQATGKSTIAKVLSICRYFSYIVDDSTLIGENFESSFVRNSLRDWGLAGFEKEGSYLKYSNEDYSLEINSEKEEIYDNNHFYILTPDLVPKSERFKKLIKSYNDLKPKKADFGIYTDWTIPHSFLTTDVKKVMNNPFHFPTERGLQSIFSLGKSSIQNLSDSLFNQLGDLARISKYFQKETLIEPLSIHYKNVNGLGYTKKVNEDEFYSLNDGASGYKSTIPIVLAVKYYNEIENRKRTFTVEEPEQNLFPTTQKKLVEFMVESVNNFDNQFVLPTHSPYILTTLSNLIYAHKIGASENEKFQKEVDKIISKESWIDVKDISVYYLNNGEAKDLVDVEECLINLDDLDNVSEIINKEFDELLKIDMALEKET
jgi:predicted ATPase